MYVNRVFVSKNPFALIRRKKMVSLQLSRATFPKSRES